MNRTMPWTAIVLFSTLTFVSCNAFENIDHATTRAELIEEGKAAIDAGECDRAMAAASAIGIDDDDDVNNLRGWAMLCSGGVTANKIMNTLFSYNSNNSTDYQMLGRLANSLVPITAAKVDKVDQSLIYFGAIRNNEIKNSSLTLAQLSKAAAIIAQRSSDSVKVRRADIYSSSACVSQNCATSPASCGAGMSNVECRYHNGRWRIY